MRKPLSYFTPVLFFVIAQLSWLSLLGIWIYWFVSNYFTLQAIDQKTTVDYLWEGRNLAVLISGVVMMIVVLVAIYFIFIYLTRQIHLTRLYDSFIASVTHELKSPLASLQMYLETFQMRDLPEENRREFVNLMIRDVERLKRLINRVLDVSAMEQHKMAYNFSWQPADRLFSRLIADSVRDLKLPEKAIHLGPLPTAPIYADADALKIAVDNILENALKYSPDRFQVDITASLNRNFLILKFRDYGIGIPESEQKRVFDKFFRSREKDLPNVKGTGLGLYLTREIVRSHKGKIWVEGHGPGKGSSFFLQFPVKKPKSKER
ncbi:MAG: HAMP domain-containing sensor histidine kinase [Calditrichia bacterium]